MAKENKEERAFGIIVDHDQKQILVPADSHMRFIVAWVSYRYPYQVKYFDLLNMVSPGLAEESIQNYEVVCEEFSELNLPTMLAHAEAIPKAFGIEGFSEFIVKVENYVRGKQ